MHAILEFYPGIVNTLREIHLSLRLDFCVESYSLFPLIPILYLKRVWFLVQLFIFSGISWVFSLTFPKKKKPVLCLIIDQRSHASVVYSEVPITERIHIRAGQNSSNLFLLTLQTRKGSRESGRLWLAQGHKEIVSGNA